MWFKKYINDLESYEAGKPIELVMREYGINEDDIIKLASNENPLGTSKKVIKIIQEEAKNAYRYPDDSMFELKEALAKKYRIHDKNLIIGSGSDQIIDFIIKAVCSSKTKILISAVTFAMYEIYAKQNEATIVRTNSGIHDVEEFISMYKKHKPSIIFLCVPNNPLGDCMSRDEVYRILDSVSKDCLVVLDCAYNEFASFKDKQKEIIPNELLSKYPNTIYLGTFSKLYGLGGLRVGYGIAQDEIIKTLNKIRPPFNITTISLKAATAALTDKQFVEETLENNFKEMAVYEEFAKDNSIAFIPSYTNFITFIFDDKVDSTKLSSHLLKNGIIIRNLKSYGMNAIRITIGLKKQNIKVLKSISNYINSI